MGLTINGTLMPSPDADGISVTLEPIWSKNTGRVANGEMTGDIIDWKTTLSVSWTNISSTEFKTILTACKGAVFFNVTYLDPETDSYVTKNFYSGSPKASLSDFESGQKRYKGVTLDLIQK